MALTAKQEKFINEYLIDLNATQAAIRAGYSSRSAMQIGEKNMRKHEIQTAISELMKSKQGETIAKQDEVLRYLTSVIRGEVDEECVVVLGEGEGCSRATTITKQVSPRDRNKAAELLGKRYGIFTDKVDISGSMVIFKGEDELED